MVDEEFTKAIEENEVVIGSQEERIGMLKLALAEKGVLTSGHCDFGPIARATVTTNATDTTESSTVPSLNEDESEGGLHL